MRYKEFVEINQGFQASVNLEYDLNKAEKIRGYIPTEQSVRILGDFLRPLYYSSDPQGRASVLIGPYGRGKSHLLLVLAALTSLDLFENESISKNEARQIQNELCDKIARVNADVGALAKAVVDSNIRTLPVIINSNSYDVNQSFLIALKDALVRANLGKLLPATYFDSAISIIEKWENGFPDAIEILKTELKRCKETLDNLKIGLRQYDQAKYQLFCSCYPKIAAGTEFNPLTNMDVVKLYMSVANALKEQTAYSGISVVFDEFSKFLEANLEKSKMLNFKIIQDMAEAATRSRDAQLHFTCVTHKEILDYSSSDSFKTVEGRFRKLRFVSTSEQSYELIANAIIKRPYFESYKKKNQEQFDDVASKSAVTTVFSDLTVDAYEEKLVSGCFPLSPLSAFALLHVSELVGQNERTLFTFLAQPEESTLRSFVDKDFSSPQWITTDYIYDYFQDLLKKEVFNTAVHSVWAKTDSALRQISNPNQAKILKAIAVINIIGDDRLKPVPAHIKASLLMSDDVFDNEIKLLLKQHILSQRDSSEFVLLTANGIDVQRSVDNYVKTSLSKINVCEVLMRASDIGFVIPRAYNDHFSMLRCFKCVYMEANVFAAYKNANQLLTDYPYDGLIIYIISKNEDSLEKAFKKLSAFSDNPQVVLCISSQPFVYENLLKQYVAANYLLTTDIDDHFAEELEVLIEDLQKRIQSAVKLLFAPSSEYSSFYTSNGKLDISRQADLNHAISDICTNFYALSPVVNNEMVNKRSLSSQIKKARDLVVSWILQHSEDNIIPCMEGYGPEVSIFKSAFTHTGLDVNTTCSDQGMNKVLSLISAFIQKSEKSKRNFQELYQQLTSAPYGIRKGIIPLYVAYVLRPYKENIVLYFRGKEIELSSSTLSGLNDNPENYEILVETGTAEKSEYLTLLQNLFASYSDIHSTSSNRVYSIVKSMQSWLRSLPEFSKKSKVYLENGEERTVSASVEVIRSELMKFEINSRELLFGFWPSKLTENGEIAKCFPIVERSKAFLDNHLSNYKGELIKKMTALFVPGYQGGLARSMMSWYEKLPESTKAHVFDANTNALLTISGSVQTFDDEALLNSLVKNFVAIAIEDWNDEVSLTFIRNLSEAISKINDYVGTSGNTEQGGKLHISIGGVSIEKTFSAEKISPLGNTAFNNFRSVFEEYNEALEPDEQLSILAKLIGEIVK